MAWFTPALIIIQSCHELCTTFIDRKSDHITLPQILELRYKKKIHQRL